MKKFWIVLIALGLIAAFSMPASAADVKFSGSYYIQGWYDNNHSLIDNGAGSAALYHQRLRVQTEFKVAEGLTLTTRFDALERNWGDRRERNLPYTAGTYTYKTPNTAGTIETASRNYSAVVPNSAGGIQEQGNIEFERVYLTANLPFGQLVAGYAQDIQWGTMFLDTVTTRPQIGLYIPVGPVTLVFKTKKDLEGGMPGYNGIGMINNSDKDIYDVAAVYKWKGGEAGVLYEYLNGNSFKTADAMSFGTYLHAVFPYFKATFGPVFLEGEFYYGMGDYRKWDQDVAGRPNVDLETYGGYLHAKVDLKPVYFGGMAVYMKGDDPDTLDKQEGNIAMALVAGQAFTPCLMLWNDPYYTVMGGLVGRTTAGDTVRTQFMDNTLFGQVYVGVKPTAKWDIVAKLAYAKAEKKPKGYENDEYGYEVDLIATYKIYDNLSYMAAAGYLKTGDYFKGTDPHADLADNYMVMHQLTLTF